MRKIIIELQVNWEGYEDVADELIVEDAIEAKVNGVGWTVLPKKETPFSEGDMEDFVEWISNNQFVYNGDLWISTKIHYSGCAYLHNEILKLWQEQRVKTIYCE